MASSTATLPFFSFPPEFRNNLYRCHFAEAYEAIVSAQENYSYLDASTFHDTVQIFLVCRQMYNETHGLFFNDFLLGTKIQLCTRNSIYAFSRLRGPGAEGIHKISLDACEYRQARHLFNPIKVALKHAVRRTTGYDSVALRRTASGNGFTMIRSEIFQVDTRLAGELLVLQISEDENGKIDLELTGPIAELDWSIIPMMRYSRQLPGWQKSRTKHFREIAVEEARAAKKQWAAAQETDQCIKEADKALKSASSAIRKTGYAGYAGTNALKEARSALKKAVDTHNIKFEIARDQKQRPVRAIAVDADDEYYQPKKLGAFGFVYEAERELRECVSKPESVESEMRVLIRHIEFEQRGRLSSKSSFSNSVEIPDFFS